MRLLRYALRNISRSLFLSLSSVIVITLMTFLIYVLFFVEHVTNSLTQSVNQRLTLSLNVRSGLEETDREVIDFLEGIRKVADGVEAKFVSAQQAYEILKKRDPELAKIIETDAENPLPSTIAIKNIPIERYGALDVVIGSHTGMIELDDDKRKKSLVGYQAQYDRIQSIIHVLVFLRYGLYTVIGFFLFSVFVVIFHSIGNAVYYFREEISVTKLVGGQRRYIYGPFLLQGMIYALAALVLSTALFVLGLESLDFSLIFGIDSRSFLDNFFSASLERFAFLSFGILALGGVSGYISAYRFTRA